MQFQAALALSFKKKHEKHQPKSMDLDTISSPPRKPKPSRWRPKNGWLRNRNDSLILFSIKGHVYPMFPSFSVSLSFVCTGDEVSMCPTYPHQPKGGSHDSEHQRWCGTLANGTNLLSQVIESCRLKHVHENPIFFPSSDDKSSNADFTKRNLTQLDSLKIQYFVCL